MTGAIPSVALVGNPNAGKSSLFNALTGARQKIANYPGVTVERKAGHASFADGRPIVADRPARHIRQPNTGEPRRGGDAAMSFWASRMARSAPMR